MVHSRLDSPGTPCGSCVDLLQCELATCRPSTSLTLCTRTRKDNISDVRLRSACKCSKSLRHPCSLYVHGRSHTGHSTRRDYRTKDELGSHRQTTRIEDEAYCLLGIFGINMSLLYGEGKNAFLRLQEELLKRSADQSVLAWDSRSLISRFGCSMLADSPLSIILLAIVSTWTAPEMMFLQRKGGQQIYRWVQHHLDMSDRVRPRNSVEGTFDVESISPPMLVE